MRQRRKFAPAEAYRIYLNNRNKLQVVSPCGHGLWEPARFYKDANGYDIGFPDQEAAVKFMKDKFKKEFIAEIYFNSQEDLFGDKLK